MDKEKLFFKFRVVKAKCGMTLVLVRVLRQYQSMLRKSRHHRHVNGPYIYRKMESDVMGYK